MTRRGSTILGALALVVAGSVLPAAAHASETTPQAPATSLVGTAGTTARAAAGSVSEETEAKGYKRCKKGWVCLFTGKNGKGAMASFRRGTTDLGDYGMNNNVSSAWNRTGKLAAIFMKKNYNGQRATLLAREYGNVADKYDDRASSLKVKGRG